MRHHARVSLAVAAAMLFAPHAAGAAAGSQTPRVLEPVSGTPTVIRAIGPKVFDGDLRDLPPVKARRGGSGGGAVAAIGRGPGGELRPARNLNTPPSFTTPEESFEGMSGGLPPDPVGDVGPQHYIQMVNSTFQIYTKSGAAYLLDSSNNPAPRNINSLWDGFGGQCETTNRGDPIVLYDQLADRWLLSQFAFDREDLDNDGNAEAVTPWYECIAISQTPDPVDGGWYLYAIQSPDGRFPDYPKLGIMPDAYYLTTVQTGGMGGGNYALDRASMLAGGPANAIYFDTSMAPYNNERFLPADMDGFIPPPPGTPGIFMRPDDATDTIELWEFDADFGSPLSSTFGLIQSLGVASFDGDPGGAPQPGDDELLEVVKGRFMHRLAYRNLGGVETLLAQHSVDVDGLNHGGIGWYLLTRIGGAWFVAQQGDHAPDGDFRWNGSMAMDRDGNVALGYSVSGFSTPASIRYAGRLVSDPPGTLPQGEAELIAGSSSQDRCSSPQPSNCRSRWGDYSSMNVDPEDDCTFWYTNEYMGPSGRSTRVGAFRFCNDPPVADPGGPYVTEEGDDVLLSALDSYDPNPTDDLTYEWDLDGDLQYDDDTDSVVEFVRGDNGSYPIGLRVTDESGLSHFATTTVTVTNVAPEVTLDPAQVTSILEGQTVDVSASFSDPGWEDTYTTTVHWGHASLGADPATTEVTDQGPPKDEGTAAASKPYGDDGSFTVTVSVSDDDGGTGEQDFTLTVGNVAPDAEIDLSGAVLVNGVPTILGHSGDPVDFAGSASDPGSDDETLSWNFDDGTPVVSGTSLVNPPSTDPDPSPSVQPRGLNDMQTHTFGDACAYEPTFSAQDDDGGSDADHAAVLITGNADRSRPAPWWKHQYDQSGGADFDQATLLCYLEIAGFVSGHYDEARALTTLQDAESVFHNEATLTPARRAFDRELLGALLNFANGGVDFGQLVVDTDGNGTFDLSFADAVAQAEAVVANPAATASDLQAARQRLQQVNQFGP